MTMMIIMIIVISRKTSCLVLSCLVYLRYLPNTRYRLLAQDSFVLVLYWGMLYVYVSYLVAFHEEDSSPGFTDEAFLHVSEALGSVICLYMIWRIRDNENVTGSPKLTCI